MTVIDAHQHFWNLDRIETSWLGPQYGPINRSFEYEDVAPLLASTDIDRAVLVQAEDLASETDYLFEYYDAHEEFVGVVGWVPLDRHDEAEASLSKLLERPGLVGIRNLIHQKDDPDWLLRDDVNDGLAVLASAGVPFDVVSVLSRHLEHVPTLSERHPELYMVIDHLSKPPIKSNDWEPWKTLIARAAENPRVYAKISGLYPPDMSEWTADDIRPFIEYASEVFGADRLMFGSDWPVSVLAGGYIKVWEEFVRALDSFDESQRDAILGQTAARFYGLDPS